jgi:hypothetical protein
MSIKPRRLLSRAKLRATRERTRGRHCLRPRRMSDQHSRRMIRRLLTAAAVGKATAARALEVDDEARCASDRTAWVASSLERMLTIKPGMTRAQLMLVFSTEGGLSTALQRTLVSRDCRYFKIDVKFRRASENDGSGGGRDSLHEMDGDVITSISQPYLQFTIAD